MQKILKGEKGIAKQALREDFFEKQADR